ncbi:hypothetical protein D869_gp129 [Caulobacter phage CcrRogue]|uniref:Uncharacterized protein n=1 Tax=Caulobacter phage CcrRogue TaxID=2927986 RepID=K4JR68_9CAUD|nr:hypothetical protein D869_gp129 [Caulobacter phage CcrRogue]AFU86785.1 hypothetical protein CcrRogue_gp303 [Caulobacter phage CcrRogue]
MTSYVTNDSDGRAYVVSSRGVIRNGTTVVIVAKDNRDIDGLIGVLAVERDRETVTVQAGCRHIQVEPGMVSELKMGQRIGDPEANEHLAHIAEMVGEGDDVGAAWESVQAIITERDTLKAAIDTALVQISGGLCYFTADAKHAQLKDAEKTLERALNGGQAPIEKRLYAEEPGDDWSLELHVFHAANNPNLPAATRELLKTLWKAYCALEQRCEGAAT